MRKLLAFVLVFTLLTAVLSGCTNTDAGKDQSASETTSASAEKTEENAETEAADDTAEPAAEKTFDHHADLKMLFIGPMPLSDEAVTRISKALSNITEEKFNCSIELVSVTFQDYANKMNMMLATGDQIDIFQPLGNLQTFASQGYLLDMNAYSSLYQDAAALLGDYIKVGQINGAQYCLPTTAQGTTGGDSWVIRKDVYDELDLGSMLKDCKLLPDLEPVLQKIKDNTDYIPLIGTTDDQVVRSQGDAINGKYYIGLNSFCYIDPDDMEKVQATAYRDTYRQMAELAYKWAQMGLTSYDEVGNATDLFKAGRSAAYYYGYSPVVQFEADNATGMETEIWKAELDKPWSSGISAWGYCVSSYSEAPEQAIAVINELYTNAELANILEWGEEGVDYVVADKEKGLVTFPEGIHPGNVGFYNFVKDSVANQFICYESVEQEGYHKLQLDFQKNDVRISPYIGFVFDSTNVENEITACTNVNSKYVSGLMNGLLDPAEYYDQYVKDLEANGLQNIIDETQKQLDAWIAENK